MDNYAVFAVLLFLAGLAVLVTEVFIPSGGVLAIITTCLLISSVFCAYAAWYERMPLVFGGFVGLVVLAVPTALGSAFYILPQTKAGKRALLEAPDLAAVEPFPTETARLRKLIGQFGTTASLLNPGGLVIVQHERLHATSEGLIIDPKSSVEIIDVRGTRIVVRPGEPRVTPSETVAKDTFADASPAPTDDRPPAIDFEIAAE